MRIDYIPNQSADANLAVGGYTHRHRDFVGALETESFRQID